jgi:deoxyribonuclease (pyrimidine dimer)
MTRVNSNIDPKTLHRLHLVAELREITMVPAALRRSLRTRHPSDIKAGIPSEFTLNSGHVAFFFDKLAFLKQRFLALCDEMERRGFTPDRSRISAFDGFESMWYGNWEATVKSNQIISLRIQIRKLEKPHLYT